MASELRSFHGVGPRLEETLEIVGFWGRYVLDKEFYDPDGWQVQNMLTAAHLISCCALRRPFLGGSSRESGST